MRTPWALVSVTSNLSVMTRDTGIYGGTVQRDGVGEVVMGQQYQNHNPHPGPVYAGGGYTPICRAIGNNKQVIALLDTYPDLVNDISTGLAQPLHFCGMSKTNEHSVALLIKRGADIEAIDSYGFTPLHRMASNNLAFGAQALLNAGADPTSGTPGQTPIDIARASNAIDVIRVLENHPERKLVEIVEIFVMGTGVASVNQQYMATQSAEVPLGFARVCKAQGWEAEPTWKHLGGGRTWFKAENDAYIYWNSSDQKWWIDTPEGAGVFKAKGPSHAPPQLGWEMLDDVGPVPELVATFRALQE